MKAFDVSINSVGDSDLAKATLTGSRSQFASYGVNRL